MTNLVAILISTNIVAQACQCGWCDERARIAVSEHINRIGYDLKEVVTTNYLPVVIKKEDVEVKVEVAK